MSRSSVARRVIASSASSRKDAQSFHSSASTLARDITPVLPGGRLSASSIRSLIAVHHLSHPIRQINLLSSSSSPSTDDIPASDQSNLLPIILHTLKYTDRSSAPDHALRSLATHRLRSRGISGRMSDRLTILSTSGSGEGEGGQVKSVGRSPYDGKGQGLNEGGGRRKGFGNLGGEFIDSTVLYHDQGRGPTTAHIINASRLPKHWSSSSSSSSSYKPPTDNTKAATLGERSILTSREQRVREALYGVSEGKMITLDGTGEDPSGPGEVPDLEAVLEWVEREGGTGGGADRV